MASKELNVRIKHKKDTESNWGDKNPILLDGEMIIVDIGNSQSRIKIGDGVSTYDKLPFLDNSTDGDTGSVSLNYETWTFTLVDGSVVSKQVVVK